MDSKHKEDLWNKLLLDFDNQTKNKSPEDVFKISIDLMSSLPHFNWTGIYWLNKGVLELFDYYIGKKTDHTKIPVGKGVCGTAVSENRDIVVDDVLQLDNYLACSIETRSEIVVLIKDNEETILGQIDIDSDQIKAFDDIDRMYMEKLAKKLALNRKKILLEVKNLS